MQFHLIKSITLETFHSWRWGILWGRARGSWWWLNILTSKWLHLIKIIFLIQFRLSARCFVSVVHRRIVSRLAHWCVGVFQLVCFMVKYSNLQRRPTRLVNKVSLLRLATSGVCHYLHYIFHNNRVGTSRATQLIVVCLLNWNTSPGREKNILIPTHNFHHISIQFAFDWTQNVMWRGTQKHILCKSASL